MDIDDPTITSSQAMSQPSCPYRPPTDAPNSVAAFQSGWSHNPHLDPSGPSFGSPSNPRGAYWAGMSSHGSPHLDPAAGGPSRQLPHSGRPGSAARYSLTPFNRTPDFASNQQRFLHPEDNNRHPIPRMPDMDRFHNSNSNRQGESQNAGPVPPVATGIPAYNPPDEAAQRRLEFMQAQMARQHEIQQQSNGSPRPPTLNLQSTFFPTHLPQPNFTSNRSPSHFQGIQGTRDTFQYSSRNMPGPPLSQPSRPVSHFEQEQRRAWIHEANLASEYGDDSDDDSLDSFNTRLDQRERDLGIPLNQARHAPAASHGQRRPAMSSSEGEERELAMERSRAARRAAVAAAKLVASPAAIASLEKVELSSLAGDDRNCIICYNEFGIKNPDGNIECAVRLPKCKHVFGDHCLKHWLKDSDSCPYCRDKLPSEPKKSHAEEMRRLFALNRPGTASTQQHGGPITAEERAIAFAAMENRHMGQAYMNRAQMQSQLHALYALEAQNRARLENAALEQSEIAMRYSMQRQEEWAAMHSHGASHVARLMPDHDSRRRNRHRANSIRSSTGNNSGGGGGASARFSTPAAHRSSGARDHNSQPPTPSLNLTPSALSGVLSNANANSNSTSRNPAITNRNIFDTANTVAAVLGQPRSVTPHPNVLESGGAAPALGGGGRRSSLPAAASEPVRDAARDAAREAMLGLQPLEPLPQEQEQELEQGVRDPPSMAAVASPTELFAATARVQSAVWAGRP
ncbi:hypothetical protein V500_10600, partial [Pseudogymnoascus sp. VKM F-4518 (FW-2643)]